MNRRLISPITVLLIMAAYALSPATAQILIYGRSRLSTEAVEGTGAVSRLLSQGLLYALIGVLGLILISEIKRIRLSPWLLVYIGPWMGLLVSSYLMEGRVSLASLVFPAVGLMVALTEDPAPLLRLIGYTTAALATVSVVAGLLLPAALFPESRESEKALIGNELLAGPLLHPNALGQTLVLGAPFLLLIPKRWIKVGGFLMVVVALLWASSRTALIAGVVGLVFLTMFYFANRPKSYLGALAPIGLLLGWATILATGPYLVATSTAASFTERGIIWSSSLQYWDLNPLFGNGPRFYALIPTRTGIFGTNAFHGHNLGVHLLTTAGLFGAAALVILAIRCVYTATKFARRGNYAIATFPAVLIAVCWLEVPTDLATFATLSWVVWVPLAVLARGPLPARDVGQEVGAQPHAVVTSPERR